MEFVLFPLLSPLTHIHLQSSLLELPPWLVSTWTDVSRLLTTDLIFTQKPIEDLNMERQSHYTFGEDMTLEDLSLLVALLIAFAVGHAMLHRWIFTYYKGLAAHPPASHRPITPPWTVHDVLAAKSEPLTQQQAHEAYYRSAEFQMTLKKFTSSLFKLVCYSSMFIVGCYCAVVDNWIYVLQHRLASYTDGWLFSKEGVVSNYQDWPEIRLHSILIDASSSSKTVLFGTSPIVFQYTFALAHYLYATGLILFNLEGIKQSDKVEMTAHHLITMFMILFSWYFKLFRVGALVLMLHDLSDPFMEVAKLMLYSGRQFFANIWFATFAFVFLLTRWVVYPLWVVLPTCWYLESEEGIVKRQELPNYQLPVLGLILLQCLHWFWGALIIRMVVQALRERNVQNDIRDED